MIQNLVKHSVNLSYNKILRRCNLRYYDSQIIGFHSKHLPIIQDLKDLKESAIKKKTIDPRVEKWNDKLLFSDYVRGRSLKYGYKTNKTIKSVMMKKAEFMEKERLTKTPAFSVTLMDNDNEQVEDFENNSSDLEDESKPIYMPYAAEDSFERVEIEESEPVEKEEEPVLNTKFKVLYEKYLETIENEENAGDNLQGKLCVRLGDDLSKVPSNWMTDYETFDDIFEENSWEAHYGTSKPNSKVSSIPCGGCGALLHCKDSEIPGYLPSELFENQKNDVLKSLVCQRCHFMKFYNTALDVKVPPEDYPELLSVIKNKECAVILMVDLTDFPSSIWPEISSIVGHNTPIYVVGNKIDLLPKDSSNFLQHVTECLLSEVLKTGIKEKNIKHVTLVSAKSGFGIEELITKLQNSWRYKGDIYLVGCTNVGKSSLFNAFLQSDYCKVQAIDLIQRATTSPWPGTTLNLLKFPLTNPQQWRLYERTKRLVEESSNKRMKEKLRSYQYHVSKNIVLATLQGRIGRSFKNKTDDMILNNFNMGSHKTEMTQKFGLNESAPEFKYSKWCYDTPGSIHPDQILHLLTTDELMITLPNRIIIPRTFVIHEGQTLFLAGLGRIDFLKIPSFLRCTVFSSHQLSMTICETIYADDIYSEFLHTKAFRVPINDPERLKLWPEMKSKDFKVVGISQEESAADVVLSSAGWVSITPETDEQISLRAWTPEGRGLFLRTPALLRKSVTLRGVRIPNCPAYKKGRAVYVKNVKL